MAAPTSQLSFGHSQVPSSLDDSSFKKNTSQKHTTFKISSGIGDTWQNIPLETAVLKAASAECLLYVKCQRQCVDLCMFDSRSQFLFSYLDAQRKHREKPDDSSFWGSELFGANIVNSCLTVHRRGSDKKAGQWARLRKPPTNSQSHRRTTVVHCGKAHHVTQRAELAAAVATTCKTSPVFLDRLGRLAHGHSEFCWQWQDDDLLHPVVRVPRIIVLHISEHPPHWTIDHAWEIRVRYLVGKKGMMEDAMSWLNTLGGGYSALGDYFRYHAEQAAKISMRQLRVALDMGDPPTVIRCHLYFGLSLMQRGDLLTAKRIIRHQYSVARQVAPSDTRLQASCHGLWSRLGYLYSLRRQRARGQPSG